MYLGQIQQAFRHVFFYFSTKAIKLEARGKTQCTSRCWQALPNTMQWSGAS